MVKHERGVSGSVQVVLLLPFVLGLFLVALQWGLVHWAQSTADAAARHAVHVASITDPNTGSREGSELLHNGALVNSSLDVTTHGDAITSRVQASAVRVLPGFNVDVHASSTGHRAGVTKP